MTSPIRLKVLLPSALMAMLVVSNAQQILNVDFGNVTVTPVAVGPAVVGNAGDVWNMHSHPFEPLATTPNLVWSDGSPSGAGITVTNASGTWVSGSTDRMMNIYLYNFGGTAFFSVTNLPAGRYDVLVYGLGGPDEEINTRFFVQSGSTRLGPRDTIPVQGWRTLTWREGLQYVRFRNVAVASGTPLVVEASGILKSTPAVNGLQLVRLDGTAPVTIFPTGPLFTNSLTLTLSGGGQIRFTTNGMAPTPESPLYSIPFQISAATIVRAAQFSGTNQVGDEVAASYLRVYAVNDGISAAWRIQNFGAGYLTDPRAAADADPDRDGSTNFQEFTAGTNPNDPQSGIALRLREAVTVSWNTVPGTRYRLLHKRQLGDFEWTVLREVTATGTETKVLIEAPAPMDGFYALSVVP